MIVQLLKVEIMKGWLKVWCWRCCHVIKADWISDPYDEEPNVTSEISVTSSSNAVVNDFSLTFLFSLFFSRIQIRLAQSFGQ